MALSSSSSMQYNYVEEQSLPSELVCTVCHDVAGTHAACPGCNQTFCQNCVHKWFNTQKSNAVGCTCPYCRRKLKFSDLKHDPAIQKQLDQLEVFCPNRPAGCLAVIQRAKVPGHLKRWCWAQPCSCKYCGKAGLRRDISSHEASECPERLVPCSNAAAGCTATVPLSLLQAHLDCMCLLQPRACADCQQQIPRRCWSHHLQSSCPARLPCHLRLYGCCYSGTAEQLEQHSQHCPYLQRRQQLEQQLAGAALPAAVQRAQAALAGVDLSELPSSCVVDSSRAFAAPSIGASAAHACQLLLQAVPVSALPPRLQQHDSNWLVSRVTAVEDIAKPAALATLTPPMQIAKTAAATAAAPAAAAAAGSCPGLPVGVSPAEALALGLPQCFSLLGLASEPWLEASWRVLLNLRVVDMLSSDLADIELPSSFMLYTAVCRAWDTVVRLLGPQQQHRNQQQQQQQQQEERAGRSSGGGGAAAAGAAVHGNITQGGRGSGGGSESDEEELQLLPGLERGLFEDEFEDLDGWLWQQRELLMAVAAVTVHVLQLWLGPGCTVLLPGQAVELSEMHQAGLAAVQLVVEVANTKKTSRKSSSTGGGAGEAPSPAAQPQQPQRQQQQGPAGARREQHRQLQNGEQQETHGWRWLDRIIGMSLLGLDAATEAASDRAAVARRQEAHPQIQQQHGQQQQQQEEQPTGSSAAAAAAGAVADVSDAAAAAATGPAQFASYSAALQHLQQLGGGPPVAKKRRTPELLQGRTPAEALELATAVLVLHSARQQHVETSLTPQTTALFMTGFRGYWAPSILAGSRAWLGPGFRLGWQAVAALSDMLMSLADRLLRVVGEGFFDPDSERVPMTPRLALAAAQLVLPPGLLSGCLQRIGRLSQAYHDEACEDLSQVTWTALQARLGLTLELDKLVTLVDQRLPVQLLDEDEDEDEESYMDEAEEEDSDDEDEEAEEEEGQSGSEYTTDDEYMQEGAQQEEQQQRLLPSPGREAGSGLLSHLRQRYYSSATPASDGGPAATAAAASTGDEPHVPGIVNRRSRFSTADADADAGIAGSNWTPNPRPARRRRTNSRGGDSSSDGSWESADSDDEEPHPTACTASRPCDNGRAAGSAGVDAYREAMTAYLQHMDVQHKPQHQQEQQQERGRGRQAVAQGAADAPASTQLAATAAGAAAGPEVDMAQQEQQEQQHRRERKAEGTAAAPAAAAGGSDWQQELAANLQQLAASSSHLPQLEQQLLQDTVQSLMYPGSNARAEAAMGSAGGVEAAQQQQQAAGEHGTQEDPQQHANSTAAAAQDKNEEGDDATTHGVVLLAGLMEAVLQQVLEAAAKAAADFAAVSAAAAGAATDSEAAPPAEEAAGGRATEKEELQQRSDEQEQQQRAVCVTARHVLLATVGSPDLKAFLLDRPAEQNTPSAAVAWAGAIPGFSSSLLPVPEQEPLTAWLSGLAAGRLGQQQQQEQEQDVQQRQQGQDVNTGSRCGHVLFPADLRFYCSRTWQANDGAPPAAITAGTACHSLVCSFLSGWQCSSCAAATAALPGDLEAQLEACTVGLAGLPVVVNSNAAVAAATAGAEAGQGAAAALAAGAAAAAVERVLTDAQRQELMEATRLYHLQQQSWYEGAQGSSNTSCSNLPGWQSMSPVDQVQLANVQQPLQPLRDVAALRQVALQQAQSDPVWPIGHFEGMVYEAVEAVAAQKGQQQALTRQLQQLVSPVAGGLAGCSSSSIADAAAGDEEESSEDLMDIDAEAVDILAAATEDFLVQQFRAANELALYAGRQQVQPQDLHMALASTGYRHLLQQLPHRGGV